MEDNLALCAIGTTDNGLVACEQLASGDSVLLSMPVLRPDLATNPPLTEQVNLAACTSCESFMHRAFPSSAESGIRPQ